MQPYINSTLETLFKLSPGSEDEYYVVHRLATLDPSTYLILNNIILSSTGNTSVTQIDHIVVSRYGIFCIETKSTTGWIFGSTDQQFWTKVFYKKRYTLANPIRQNYCHIKAIE
jgi:hypothetical protein